MDYFLALPFTPSGRRAHVEGRDHRGHRGGPVDLECGVAKGGVPWHWNVRFHLMQVACGVL